MRLKRPEGLNVVPFIDIMLVLLAIVLTISTFIAQGKIKVDLPIASAIEEKTKEEALKLIISSDDKLYVELYGEDIEITLQQFKERAVLLRNSDEIIIMGDKLSSFGIFVEIVDVLKAKGHENIQIVTKYEK